MTLAWRIATATRADLDARATLRAALWPDATAAAHRAELDAPDGDDAVAFLAFDDTGAAIGLAEATLRHGHVNGTDSSPVGFLEGWYVEPAWRGHGVGRALVQAVVDWTRAQGCSELASDTALDNTGSQAAHVACGFEETERVVYFRRRLET